MSGYNVSRLRSAIVARNRCVKSVADLKKTIIKTREDVDKLEDKAQELESQLAIVNQDLGKRRAELEDLQGKLVRDEGILEGQETNVASVLRSCESDVENFRPADHGIELAYRDDAISEEDVSEEAVSAEAVSAEAVSAEAVSAEAVSAEAVSAEAAAPSFLEIVHKFGKGVESLKKLGINFDREYFLVRKESPSTKVNLKMVNNSEFKCKGILLATGCKLFIDAGGEAVFEITRKSLWQLYEEKKAVDVRVMINGTQFSVNIELKTFAEVVPFSLKRVGGNAIDHFYRLSISPSSEILLVLASHVHYFNLDMDGTPVKRKDPDGGTKCPAGERMYHLTAKKSATVDRVLTVTFGGEKFYLTKKDLLERD